MKTIYLKPSVHQQNIDLTQRIEQSVETLPLQFIDKLEGADYVFIIGDDSHFLTTLRAMKYDPNPIYVGISPTEEKGFYTNFTLTDLEDLWPQLTNRPDFSIHNLLKIQVDKSNTWYALNEFSIKSSIIRSIVIDIAIDHHHFERFKGDGLIISTPTGSTGYSKSAGGAIIDPELDLFQLTKVLPVSCKAYQAIHSPMCFQKDRIIRLNVVQDGNDHPIIGLDTEAFPIHHTQKIDISMTDHQVRLLSPNRKNYFMHLKSYFNH